MEINKDKLKICQHHMKTLNDLVGLEFNSYEEIAETINENTGLPCELFLEKVLAVLECGPMYHFVANTIDDIKLSVFVTDKGNGHFVSGIEMGPIATYESELIRNVIKRAAN